MSTQTIVIAVSTVAGLGLATMLYFNRLNKIKTAQRQNLYLEPSKYEQEQQFHQEGLTDYNDGEPKFGGKRKTKRKTKKNKKL
jgi:hypothetical protein